MDALARFAHLLATAPSSTEVHELLVNSAVDVVGAGGALLVLVDHAGMARIVARRGFDAEVVLGTDLLGIELTGPVLAASQGQFTSASALPLVAAGGLYGVLVLLLAGHDGLDDPQLKLAATVVDLAAATLARASEHDELERAYEELKASRQALAHAEKLRALGGMAAGISHDLKNVFTPMLLMLDVLKTSTGDGDAMRERIEKLRRPLNNGLAIVERLRSFSRPGGDDRRELCELKPIVDDALDLCQLRSAATHVDISLEASAAPMVRVEVGEAVAAITNLVVNALDAVAANGGRVNVRVGTREAGAFVEIADTGPGVPPELRDRIFAQFFSTKGKEGTGLGLATVHEFAQRHGGKIELESPSEGGARFTLWLPRALTG
ncbi:MAG: HAMP domain-containing sensor histidine kinase [Deltaproteobacteria bacterium]|nr:HAMP domain-containing sensor histidine kinase [Deltaproteobacteria bacterium]